MPELAVVVAPLALGATRPPLVPPPPPPVPAPTVDLGNVPYPRFLTTVGKPLPPASDPGSFKCAFLALRGAQGVFECGLHRLLDQDVPGARAAFEESLAAEPRGAQAPAAHAWLGEIALLERNREAATRHYRAALNPILPADLRPHVELGLGLLALGAGDAAEADRALGRALAPSLPQPVATVARYFQGIARLLGGQPDAALLLLEQAAQPGAPSRLLEEAPFWRGVTLGWRGDAEGAEQTLDRFARSVPSHPLRADALAQIGFVLLERGRPGDAERRFRDAEGLSPRAELRPQLRLGFVRAYLDLGDVGRAAAAARRLAAETPRDPLVGPALLKIAQAAEKRDAPGEALDVYRQMLQVPLAPALQDYVVYRLAEGLERDGRLPEAKDRYRALRDRGQDEGIATRAAYRLALVALAERDLGGALREGEALIRAGTLPELREGVLLLSAEAAARGDDVNRAATLLRLALREFPSSPRMARTRLALGWALAQDGDPESARAEWQGLIPAADHETRALAALALADVALRLGREAEALEALRLVGTLPAGSPGAPGLDVVAIDRGILALRGQAYAEAVQALEPVAARVTDYVRQALVRRALGLARYRLGEYDVAERQFRQAASLAPAEPTAWLGAGVAALAQARFAEAEDALARARMAAPEVAAIAHYGLVVSAWSRQDPEAFRERATSFVDRYPGHPAAPALLYALVATAADQGQVDQAGAWVRRLLRLEPPSEYAGDALGRLAGVARGRPEVLRDAYRDLLAHKVAGPQRADAWLGLGEAALATGDFREAQRAAEGFLQEAPADPRVLAAQLLLLRAYQGQGQRGRALEVAGSLLARFPGDPAVPAIRLLQGQVLIEERRWDAAQEALQAARDLGDPTVAAPAQFWLGEALRARGDVEAAIAAYLGATYLYPESPWAARGLQGAAQAYVSRRMLREAGILLRKLVGLSEAEPALVQWARTALAQLGPAAAEAEGARPGSPRP
jgi:tetratricopeptide (TPR) repeat protein